LDDAGVEKSDTFSGVEWLAMPENKIFAYLVKKCQKRSGAIYLKRVLYFR
jgi:hypothetical protein